MSQPNDPQSFENDDQSFGSLDEFSDLDFSALGSDAPASESPEAVGGDFPNFDNFDDEEVFVGNNNIDSDFPSPAPEEAPPETGKKGKKAKKAKPPKAKKEKPPKPPRDPNAPGLRVEEMLALGACVLLAVVFLVLSVFSLGSMMFLILMDLIAVVIIAVPFLLYKSGREATLFDVSLGMAVIALSVGAILLLAVWKDYGFTIKPNASLNERQVVSTHDA